MAAPIAPAVLAELLGSGWRRHRETADALADALRALAVDGRIAARTRIPSERALAPALGVGRGTVTRAYDRLREDGFLVSARGAGSWLTLPDGAAGATQPMLPPLHVSGPRALDLSIAAPAGPEPLLGEA
ncbi:MAG: GntR family transcriptional regulator, partial [Solirubrobacteraceae bacterium]